MKKYVILVVLILGTLVSLVAQNDSDELQTKLTGTWILVSESRDSLHVDPTDLGFTTRISFSSKGAYTMRASGYQMSAIYHVDGNTIKWEDILENGIRYKEARWATVVALTDTSLILKRTVTGPDTPFELYRKK